MTIRRAGPFDPPALAAVHAACFPPEEAWGEAILAAHLSMPGVFALLAETGGMVLARVAADEAEILTLAVAPAARRGGLGRALVRGAAALAQTGGAARLFLEVSEANNAARALYAGLGFRRIGTRPRYYPDFSDALLLRSDLPLERDRPGLDRTSVPDTL